MIVIYRGEDTDFLGQDPIQVKIETPYDLTGCTADILFGSVTKHFETDEVATKTLGLSFTATETAGFFPGKGYASIKVYDSNEKVAILKRFVIEVKFRGYEKSPMDTTDVSEVVSAFENIRAVANEITELTEDDDIEVVKDVINRLLVAARKRTEFDVLSLQDLSEIPAKTIINLTECVRKITALAYETEMLDGDAGVEEVKALLNDILSILHIYDEDTSRNPKTFVTNLQEMARGIGKVLRTQRV